MRLLGNNDPAMIASFAQNAAASRRDADSRRDRDKMERERKLVADLGFKLTEIYDTAKTPEEIKEKTRAVLQPYKESGDLTPEMFQLSMNLAQKFTEDQERAADKAKAEFKETEDQASKNLLGRALQKEFTGKDPVEDDYTGPTSMNDLLGNMKPEDMTQLLNFQVGRQDRKEEKEHRAAVLKSQQEDRKLQREFQQAHQKEIAALRKEENENRATERRNALAEKFYSGRIKSLEKANELLEVPLTDEEIMSAAQESTEQFIQFLDGGSNKQESGFQLSPEQLEDIMARLTGNKSTGTVPPPPTATTPPPVEPAPVPPQPKAPASSWGERDIVQDIGLLGRDAKNLGESAAGFVKKQSGQFNLKSAISEHMRTTKRGNPAMTGKIISDLKRAHPGKTDKELFEIYVQGISVDEL